MRHSFRLLWDMFWYSWEFVVLRGVCGSAYRSLCANIYVFISCWCMWIMASLRCALNVICNPSCLVLRIYAVCLFITVFSSTIYYMNRFKNTLNDCIVLKMPSIGHTANKLRRFDRPKHKRSDENSMQKMDAIKRVARWAMCNMEVEGGTSF